LAHQRTLTPREVRDTSITFVGEDPIFPRVHRPGACIAIPIMAGAAGIADIRRQRIADSCSGVSDFLGLLRIASHAEPRRDLHHANDDQPDSGNQSQRPESVLEFLRALAEGQDQTAMPILIRT
jgi:hypothetical protein